MVCEELTFFSPPFVFGPTSFSPLIPSIPRLAPDFSSTLTQSPMDSSLAYGHGRKVGTFLQIQRLGGTFRDWEEPFLKNLLSCLHDGYLGPNSPTLSHSSLITRGCPSSRPWTPLSTISPPPYRPQNLRPTSSHLNFLPSSCP